MDTSDSEVDRNYRRFSELLPELLRKAPGRYALFHAEELVDIFDTSVAAVSEGLRRFGDASYSVQKITGEPENLGFYSYAGGAMQA